MTTQSCFLKLVNGCYTLRHEEICDFVNRPYEGHSLATTIADRVIGDTGLIRWADQASPRKLP